MKAGSFSIRPATPADAADMVRLHHAAVHAIAGEWYPPDTLLAWSPEPDQQRIAWLAGVVAQASVVAQVAATPEGCLAGFCLAIPAEHLLKALYVHPDFAGKGIGRALLGVVESEGATRGLDHLLTHASLNAVSFYAAAGYAETGPFAQPLSAQVAMQAISMVKRF